MNYLYVLLFLEVALLYFIYFLFEGDFISPSIMTITGLIIATLFNIYSIDAWNINFNPFTLLVIGIGMIIMIISEFLIKILFNSKFKKIQKNTVSKLQIITIQKWKVLSITLLNVIFVYLYYREVKRVGAQFGTEGVSAIASVKSEYAEGNQHMNVFIRQSYKFVTTSAYIHSLIFINNVLVKKDKFIDNFLYFISIVCAIIIVILSGGRLQIVRLMSGFMFQYFILWQENSCWNKKSARNATRKVLKTGLPVAVLTVFILRSLHNLIKTSSSNLNNGIDYIAYYIGCGIQSLNIVVTNGIPKTNLWGERTFYYLQEFLYSIGLLNTIPTRVSYFVYLGGESNAVSNVYTIFGRPFIDFGLGGMLIFIAILYMIFCYIYYFKIKESRSEYHRNKTLILYSYFYYIFTMAFYDNCISISFDIIPTILYIICILFLYKFYFHSKNTNKL